MKNYQKGLFSSDLTKKKEKNWHGKSIRCDGWEKDVCKIQLRWEWAMKNKKQKVRWENIECCFTITLEVAIN